MRFSCRGAAIPAAVSMFSRITEIWGGGLLMEISALGDFRQFYEMFKKGRKSYSQVINGKFIVKTEKVELQLCNYVIITCSIMNQIK